MKSKRQTIWLVSMLSLMVVLSAYYLFTEDTPPAATTEGQQVSTTNQTPKTAANGATSDDGVILSEVLNEGEAGETAVTDDNGTTAAEDTKKDTAEPTQPDATTKDKTDTNSQQGEQTKSDKETGGSKEPSKQAPAATDEDVLKQMESQSISSGDSLTAYQFERNQENMKKTEELMKAISSEKSLEEAAMAQKQLDALEEKEEKIHGIEEKLLQQYSNAVVTEADSKYKVVVVSEKMAAKEAVSIMDMVIKELGVSQDKVSVQYVKQ